ncbi:MAG: alpha/beta fold hydrolase [Devosia sp.]|nr:alpha/beta fold hydrolase [Devosia sp.]
MADAKFVTSDGVSLEYEVVGDGVPVLWQHGLGADRSQPSEVFPYLPGVKRITLECRGHGRSDLGDETLISMDQFADDVIALFDHLGIERAVVGGISLGAAIALRLAAIHADRVSGLILARPAWVDAPSLNTQAGYIEVGELIRDHGAVEGARRFETSANLAAVEAASRDNAKSLRWFFERARPETTIALLSRLPKQWPGIERDAIGALQVPTLVIANGEDYVHPLAYAQDLAELIPGAQLAVVTSKTVDRTLYVTEFKAAIADFLQKGFMR